jgi:anti-anti-sigma factor
MTKESAHMDFDVIEIAPDINRVVLRGRLDAAAAEKIELRFTASVATAPRHALVDMRGLEFLGSLGVRMLIAVARVLGRRGLKMVIHGATPTVGEVMHVVSLDDLIPIVATEEEARALLAG